MLSAGCARTLREVDWTPLPPEASCTVNVTRTDSLGRWSSEQRFDRDGRLLFGSLRPAVDGRGFERLTWEGDHLVLVESSLEQDARSLPCDVVGGCDTPKTRTRERRRLHWDDSRLVQIDSETDAWTLVNGSKWRHRRSDDETFSYRWKDGRLVGTRGGRGPVKFEYDAHGQLVRRTFEEGGFTHVTELEWTAGRVTTARWSGYVQTFSYDASGRLVRDALTREDRPEDSRIIGWHYDAAGRLDRRTETRRPGHDRLGWQWEYDDDGRLVTTRDEGGVEVRDYAGDCAAGLGAPRPPMPLELAQVSPCFTSPGHLYQTCIVP